MSKILLQFLTDHCIQNRAIFVVRYYSGIKIGKDRYQCALQVAKAAILQQPYNDILKKNQSFDEQFEQEPSTVASEEKFPWSKPPSYSGCQASVGLQKQRQPHKKQSSSITIPAQERLRLLLWQRRSAELPR